MKDNRFVRGRLNSVKYSFIGAYKLLTTEHSIMVQFFIGLVVTFAGFYFDISATEWMLQIMAIGLVVAVEGMNTVAEKIADFIHPDFHKKIGFIKDIASGAVFFAALAAVAVGLIIYYPKTAVLF